METEQTIMCELCERDVLKEGSEKHHLIPGKRKWKKIRRKDIKTIRVCWNCADQIHKLFTNSELRREYNTLEKLKASEKIQKWVAWINKTNKYKVCMKSLKRKR